MKRRRVWVFGQLNQRRLVAVVFVLLCACIGAYSVIISHAATPTAGVEAENGSKTLNAQIMGDSTASNGYAIKFGVSGGSHTNCLTRQSRTQFTVGCGYPTLASTGPLSSAVLTKVPSQATSGTNWTCHQYGSNPCAEVYITGNVGTPNTGLELATGIGVVIPDGTNNAVIQNIKVTGVGGVGAEGFHVGTHTCQTEGCGPNNITLKNCSATGLGTTGSTIMGLGVHVFWTAKSVSIKNCNFTKNTSGVFYESENGHQETTDNYIETLYGWDYTYDINCADATASQPDKGYRTHTNVIGDTSGPPDQTSSWLIEHNTLIMDTGCMTSVISLFNDGGPQSYTHATINNNLMAGGNYTISNAYGGVYVPVNPYITVTNNRFSPAIFPNGGYYGLYYIFPPNSNSSTNIYGGNVWDNTGRSADNSNFYQ